MRTQSKLIAICQLLFSLCFPAHGQGTAFTYQGGLNDGIGPANGVYDLQFTLFATNTDGMIAAGPITNAAVAVSNGVVFTQIDFGANDFPGPRRWLELAVRTNGAGAFVTLVPRQEITTTPYAITAGNLSGPLSTAGLSGEYGSRLTFDNLSNQFTGTFVGNGSGLTNINTGTIGGLPVTAFWQLGGNNVAAGQFLGSTNNQPVELWVNGGRALRLEPGLPGGGGPNVIGGSPNNSVPSGIGGVTIAGGQNNSALSHHAVMGGGDGNSVEENSDGSTIAGGAANVVQTNAAMASIGGGEHNSAGAYGASVSGGSYNAASGQSATVGGGRNNFAAGSLAAVGGGELNSASDTFATIGGGSANTASAYSATVAGGLANSATGYEAAVGGGNANTAGSDNSAIGGGAGNNIQNNSPNAVIAGGYRNNIQPNAGDAFIGGGNANVIQPQGGYSVIAGGSQNYINGAGSFIGGGGYDVTTYAGNSVNALAAVIVGGLGNTVSADHGFIGGGEANTITSGGQYAAIPGGFRNTAGGYGSLAAGAQAQATNDGSFVWSDASSATFFGSTNNNSFNVRAMGGVQLVTGGAGLTLDGNPVLTTGNALGLTIQLNPSGAPNVIEGSSCNWVSNGVIGATISGGGAPTDAAGNIRSNSVTANFGTVGGGCNNNANGNSTTVAGGSYNWARGVAATIGGGSDNTADSRWTTVAGGDNNTASGESATVGGGGGNEASGYSSTLGGGDGNTAAGDFSTVGGGHGHFAGGAYAVVSGGQNNSANGDYATVPGGQLNRASGQDATAAGGLSNTADGDYSTVGGGQDNLAGYEPGSTVAGGLSNTANSDFASIGGGAYNTASGAGSTVPGGESNTASGDHSLAAGYHAEATNNGSFVWADASSSGPFASTADNSFSIRAAGGVLVATTPDGTVGVVLTPGASSWTTISDRNAKKNFRPIDPGTVLEKLAAIPIAQWNYRWERDTDVPNIGPMAQDFKHAFYPGRDDKGISTLEFDGVELAAIQGLNQKLEATRAENAALKQSVAELKRMVQSLIDKK